MGLVKLGGGDGSRFGVGLPMLRVFTKTLDAEGMVWREILEVEGMRWGETSEVVSGLTGGGCSRVKMN